MLTQLNLSFERLTTQRKQILDGIANNPAADWKARVAAHHLAAEIAATLPKLYHQAPILLSERHRFPINNPFVSSGSTGIRLVEVKDPETEQVIRHKIVTVSEEEGEEKENDEFDDEEIEEETEGEEQQQSV
jgi:hypothetical protein